MVTLSTLQALHSHTATLLSGTSYPELSLQSRTLNLCLRSFFGVEHQESCIYQHPPKAHCPFPLELSTLEKLGGSGPSMRWWVVGSGQVCSAVISRTHILACVTVTTACSCCYPDQCLHVSMFVYVFMCVNIYVHVCLCVCPCVWKWEVNFKCLQSLPTLLFGTASFTEPGAQKFSQTDCQPAPEILLSGNPALGLQVCTAVPGF